MWKGLVSAGFRVGSTSFRWFRPVSGHFGWFRVIPLFSNYDQRTSILAPKVFNIGLKPVQLKNLQPLLSVKASKCSKTSKSCKETSETKDPSKQTADDVLAAIPEKQWDVDCVPSFGQNTGENLVRPLMFFYAIEKLSLKWPVSP